MGGGREADPQRRRTAWRHAGWSNDSWLQRLAKMWRPTSKETKTDATCLYIVYYTNIRVPIESREICFLSGKFISWEIYFPGINIPKTDNLKWPWMTILQGYNEMHGWYAVFSKYLNFLLICLWHIFIAIS